MVRFYEKGNMHLQVQLKGVPTDVLMKSITVIEMGLNPAGTVVSLLGTEMFAIWSIENRGILYELMQKEQSRIINIIKKMLEMKLGPYYAMSWSIKEGFKILCRYGRG